MSVILAGTSDIHINENVDFSDYTHRADNPSFKQWDVFGFGISVGEWPNYFEEKNDYWRWLNPGVLLLKRESPENVTSLNLPARKHGKLMYFRVVPNRSYVCGLTLLSGHGGQQIEMLAKAHNQNGEQLWEKRFPKREIMIGQNEIVFQIDLPELSEAKLIYNNDDVDTEIQLAMEARFSALDSYLVISRAVLSSADAVGITENPRLTLDGEVIEKQGTLVPGYPFAKEVRKPKSSRILVEGRCGGSHRMLWYCQQSNIDWQVRNAPVADRGDHLEIDAPTDVWSTGKEIVIVPAANTKDACYVHRLRHVTRARIWPLNRGNKEVSVEVLAVDGDEGTVEVRSARKPKAVNGAARWEYRDGSIFFSLSPGQRATVIV